MSKPNVLQVVLPADCKAYVERLADHRAQSESAVGREFLVPLIREQMDKLPLPILSCAKPRKPKAAKP